MNETPAHCSRADGAIELAKLPPAASVFASADPGGCPCVMPSSVGCQCPPAERALRAWSGARIFMPPMTAEQREVCLAAVDKAIGMRRRDYQESRDHELASAALEAWYGLTESLPAGRKGRGR